MTATLQLPGVYRGAFGDWNVVPASLGPTWQRDPGWDRDDPFAEFVLPEITLGWQIIAWVQRWLLDDEGNPFDLTFEQRRFLLWWYAIDEDGKFAYRRGILQRLKGWGKDPLAAVMCAVELVGPCRFGGWLADVTDEQTAMGLSVGDPWGVDKPRAWVQLVAVSLAQTQNTMLIFDGLFSPEAIDHFGLDLNKEVIYAHGRGGVRKIQAVTSSWKTMEGNRPTFVVLNETHLWDDSNEGHQMYAVISRNLTKAKGGQARALSITNAYEPRGNGGEGSVAQKQREAWENENAGLAVSTRVLYDSLEAPEDARIRPPKEGKTDPEPTDEQVRAYLAAILRAVRGDATWLEVDGIIDEILDTNNPQSQSRRFYFNNIVSAEDAWVDAAAVSAAIDTLVAAERLLPTHDPLRVGWNPVLPDDDVVLFFDGSKSDDATGIVGCRLSDGYVFTVGVWQKPRGLSEREGKTWQVPRGAVDERVDEAFARFNVVAFWGDPSHSKDDEDSTSYWSASLDRWHRKYHEQLQVWSMKTGKRVHSIDFDMTYPSNQQIFVEAAELFVEEIQALDDVEEYVPMFAIDGHPALVSHLTNAKKALNNRWGVSLMKRHREAAEKIDLAVCAVGAKMLRRLVLNKGLEEEDAFPDGAEIWGGNRRFAGALD